MSRGRRGRVTYTERLELRQKLKKAGLTDEKIAALGSVMPGFVSHGKNIKWDEVNAPPPPPPEAPPLTKEEQEEIMEFIRAADALRKPSVELTEDEIKALAQVVHQTNEAISGPGSRMKLCGVEMQFPNIPLHLCTALSLIFEHFDWTTVWEPTQFPHPLLAGKVLPGFKLHLVPNEKAHAEVGTGEALRAAVLAKMEALHADGRLVDR
jgi:hypothetical protein